MPNNRRSRIITQGVARSPNRAMLRAVGFGDGDVTDTTSNTVMYLKQTSGTTLTQLQLDAANPVVSTPKTPVTFSTGAAWTTDYAGKLTRASGSWLADGYLVGQTVALSGLTGSWRIAAINPTEMVLVDGPALFGRIAATNALSDVYAMGGTPISALSLVCYPQKGDWDVLGAIIRGGQAAMNEHDVVVLGWHSLKNTKLDAIPDLSDTQVIVYSKWDRSPDIMEDQVSYPITSALLGMPKVKDIRGTADGIEAWRLMASVPADDAAIAQAAAAVRSMASGDRSDVLALPRRRPTARAALQRASCC